METAVLATGVANPQQFQNVGECIKSTEQYAQRIYQNVCDGTSYVVANGFWNYIGLWLITVFLIAATLFLIFFMFKAIFD